MASKFFKALAISALAIQLVVPAFALAEDGAPQSDDRGDMAPRGDMGAQFCSRLTTFGSKTDQDFYGRETKLKANRDERGTKLEDKWGTRDAALKSERMKRDENINARFDKIGSGDLTDAQKTALETFKSAYTQAVTTREAAVNTAIKTYRDGVAAAMSTHQTAIDAAISTFQSAIKAAQDKAKSDCGSGVNAQTVRQTLVASIQNAKDALQTTLQGIDNRADVIKPLVDARNQAVQKALDAFKAAIAQARTNLQVAFPTTQK